MTTTNNGGTRHAEVSAIEKYFADHVDGVLSIEGTPPARLVVSPSSSELAIRVTASANAPDVSAFANISLDYLEDEGTAWHQLTVKVDGNLGEVYATLCSIVDRVQVSGTEFRIAVDEVLDSLADILARRRGLSEDQQLGLAGELLSVLAINHESGPDTAVDAWTGPLGEEHDFGLPGVDVEVKVTLSEKRHHWISSLPQLVPTPGRDLLLLSVQLTPAGAGRGWSLADLVKLVRSSIDTREAEVEARLEGLGFHKIDVDLYGSRWALRTEPAFFRVDDQFPVISQESLERAVPSSNRVLDVRYRIDLTGLPTASPPFSFDALIQGT
jgi:Putative  PD-(D/E)XK family member, (DUF4420)